MTKLKITEAAIRSRVGERSYARGKSYFLQNAILKAQQEGPFLRARCRGSAPRPYRLWVQLGGGGIVAANCSCPVGDGGYCKHTAALLLTWLHRPEAFQEEESLEEILDQREKADLILLIRQMITRHPELEELVELYPAGSAAADAPVNPDLIRRQVKNVFQNAVDKYGHYDGDGLSDEVESIMQQAEPYRERGAWVAAATIYRTVLDTLLALHAETFDEEGSLHRNLWEGSNELGECLWQIDQPEERRAILRTLANIILADIKVGGYGISNDAYGIVLDQATEAERQEMASWVEEEVASHEPTSYSSGWRLGAYGGFLLDLQEEMLSDEEIIDICRRTGRSQNLVHKLLQLDRVDEAISSATSASDYTLLSLADLFVEHGHAPIAEELVWERAGKSNDTRLDAWLKNRAVDTGDWQQAVAHAESHFWQRPQLEQYREIKEIAARLGDWPERRERILSTLAAKNEHGLLTRIHLDEGDVEAALASFSRVKFGRTLAIQVAEAAEEALPQEAIRLYQERIERLIAGRGRGNYAEASKYLLRVRALYEKQGEADRWQTYAAAIRNQKPRLPALLDEMDKAGL